MAGDPRTTPGADGTIHALHYVDTFLTLTENWVYPQVTRVPRCEGRVVCRAITNSDAFPLPTRRLMPTPPPWNRTGGFPRLLNSIGFRLGRPDFFVECVARTWPAHLLHAHFGTRGWEILPLKRRLRLPLVTSFYGYDAWMMPEERPFWRERFHELFGTGEVFLVEGDAMKRRLIELGCDAGKIVIHRIGIDLTSLPYRDREFGRGLDVLMVGRFIEKKGMAQGLRACALARAQGVDLRVTIVGDAPATDAAGQAIKSELTRLAATAPLAGRVRFTGFVPLAETRRLLTEHNVFLAPSVHAANGDAEGGSPVILTEAMASGLLCIGTRHCDIPDVIIDGETGHLAPERDPEALARLLRTAANDRSAVIAQAGRRRVETHFSLDGQLAEKRRIYADVIAAGVR